MPTYKLIYFTILGFAVLSIISCKKETEASFTVPATYRFNSPNLADKNVYKIDNQSKKVVLLTDSLGDFNRANNVISDSINIILKNEFVKSFIRTIQFIDGGNAVFEYGKLDTTAGKNLIIPTESKKTKYILSGNNIQFDSFPNYFAELNNSFLEVNLCQEFTYRSQKTNAGHNSKRYFYNNCKERDPLVTIARIQKENPGVIYDTISVERVNYIFSKY